MSHATKKITHIHEPVLALADMTDDRAAAIMAGAFLEYTLGLALRARMRDLTPPEIESVFDNHGHGALNTFSQKLWLGYAFNLYGTETRKDLLAIKNIRNLFAHEPEAIDFSDSEVVALCAKLGTPKKLAALIGKPERTQPRKRYMDTVHFFASRFHIIAEKNIERPPTPPNMDLS